MRQRFNHIFAPSPSTARSQKALPLVAEPTTEPDEISSSSSSSARSDEGDECSSLSQDEQFYHADLQRRRALYHLPAMPQPPHPKKPQKIPRLFDAPDLEERRLALARGRAALQREKEAFEREVLLRGDSLELDEHLELQLERFRLRHERLQCLQRLTEVETHPAPLILTGDGVVALPDEVAQALERQCCEILDRAVLQRLVRHLNAPLVLEQLRRGQLALYTLETEMYFITVGQRVSDQSVAFYTKIAKQSLALSLL